MPSGARKKLNLGKTPMCSFQKVKKCSPLHTAPTQALLMPRPTLTGAHRTFRTETSCLRQLNRSLAAVVRTGSILTLLCSLAHCYCVCRLSCFTLTLFCSLAHCYCVCMLSCFTLTLLCSSAHCYCVCMVLCLGT